jgi:hypothetical protein
MADYAFRLIPLRSLIRPTRAAMKTEGLMKNRVQVRYGSRRSPRHRGTIKPLAKLLFRLSARVVGPPIFLQELFRSLAPTVDLQGPDVRPNILEG